MVKTRRTQASQQGEVEGSQFPFTGSATLQQEESLLPDPPLPSPPAPISRSFVSLSEEELDRRIATKQQQDCLEKKRTYLQALERGEAPIYDSVWDAPAIRTNRHAEPYQQPSSEI
ncbi:hypothetical protein B7463_g5290, partial [Scytalidium lignicola]